MEAKARTPSALARGDSAYTSYSMVRKKSEGSREPKLLRVGVAAYELGLHPFTVRRWIKQGKIQAVRIGLEARIPRSEIERLRGSTDERLLVLYGRVSGQGQKDDLKTQLERLQGRAKTERDRGATRWSFLILALASRPPVNNSRGCSRWSVKTG